MRKITADNEPPKQETATVYLYQESYDVIDAELNKNFNMSIKDLSNSNKKRNQLVMVRMIPPKRKITVKEKKIKYNITENDNIKPIDFGIDKIDISKYQITITEKTSLTSSYKGKSEVAAGIAENIKFTEYMLVFEIAKYFPMAGALKIEEILQKSFSGIENVLKIVNDYNQILFDEIIPKIFAEIYKIETETTEEEREIVLLKKPDGDNDYYEFYADPALLAHVEDAEYTKYKDNSFHASHYVFDSKPELECFIKFLQSKDVKNVYFTGMFTDRKKTDFAIGYTDPDTKNYRNYYPDFLVQMKDGSYQIIEVKGDNKIDDETVIAKKVAAQGLATGSNMIYRLIAGSDANNPDIVNPNFESKIIKFPFTYSETPDGYGMGAAADNDTDKNGY